ncbi:MAG: DUF4296 domain-containing protein [Crocinitomicaceae bacterium]
MKVLIFISFIGLFGCSTKIDRPDKPKDIVPLDTFKTVLKEMIIMETHIKQKQPIIMYYYPSMRATGKEVMRKYKIDSTRYRTSFEFYSKDQDEMIKIYSSIIDEINRDIVELKEN